MAMKSIMSRQQKAFKMNALFLIEANNVDIEEAISRLFVFLRTNGRAITQTHNKTVFQADTPDAETPMAVVRAIAAENGNKLQGIDDGDRQALIASWLEEHFALLSRKGKTRGGPYRMSGLRPLHFNVIKLFNPQVRSQDRFLGEFLFNVLRDEPVLYTNSDSLLKKFFGLGVQFYGDNDLRIDETKLTELARENRLDIELLFLLRLTEPFPVDKCSLRKEDHVAPYSFLCPEQIELLRKDLQLLFLYKEHVPRRELINYMTTLMVFHTALYFFQTVKIANHAVANGKLPPARGTVPAPGEGRTHVPFDLNLFCDLTSGHDDVVKSLAETCYNDLFKEVEGYFRSGYYLKKLEEFATPSLDPKQREQTGRDYIQLLLDGFRKHPDLDGYFTRDIYQVIEASKDDEGEDNTLNSDIQRLVDVAKQRKLNKLETFVEILLHLQYGNLRDKHRKLIGGLCRIEQESGFLTGKGRAKRRFVLGNELLEVLIQLAVLHRRDNDSKFETRPVPIREFVDWLARRYGLLVDQLSLNDDRAESESVNRALATNYDALKTRLRQLGFFTDLADASNSQVIAPRFEITRGELQETAKET